MPVSDPDPHGWGQTWQESDKVCYGCAKFRVWQTGWFDDTDAAGGACIGTNWECGACGWWDNA